MFWSEMIRLAVMAGQLAFAIGAAAVITTVIKFAVEWF
jgi:hypothetical protein